MNVKKEKEGWVARKLLGCGSNSSRGVNRQFERE
jgi:hypothetical protein